jgi:hypothetical protein
MFTKAFLAALAERAVKTFAQALLALLTASGFDVVNANWVGVLVTALFATLLSVLTSIVSSGINADNGPSLTTEKLRGVIK